MIDKAISLLELGLLTLCIVLILFLAFVLAFGQMSLSLWDKLKQKS